MFLNSRISGKWGHWILLNCCVSDPFLLKLVWQFHPIFEEELKAFQQSKQVDGVSAKPKMFVLEGFLNIIKSVKETEAQLEFLCWGEKKGSLICFLKKSRTTVNVFRVHNIKNLSQSVIPGVYNHTH